MKKILNLSLVCLIFIFMGCKEPSNKITLTVKNESGIEQIDSYLSVSVAELKIVNSEFDENKFALYDEDELVPFQAIAADDGSQIGFVINLKPNENKTLTINLGEEADISKLVNRTYAELGMKPLDVYIDGKFRGDKFENVTKIKVPEIHTDHDALFKYEGPGWESEKVGYRFYMDWRNANDIFGKKVNQLVLANVGVHDTVAKDDSYHLMQDWGMDIFKVGSSLGIGSIGMWYDGKVNMVSQTDSVYFEIPHNGPIKSEIKTSYYGWQVGDNKYDLVSRISITAGSRLTNCKINISANAENIVTGLAKSEATNFITNDDGEGWAYIALYGTQSVADPEDKLGIAVLYNQADLIKFSEDKLSHIIQLKPEQGKVEYYFCAAWEQEPYGITTEKDFIKYLNHTISLLNNPNVVELN